LGRLLRVLGCVLGRVHPHIHTTVLCFFMLHTPALYTFTDGIFLDAKPVSSFLYCHPVLGCVLVLSHAGDTRPLGPEPKALRQRPQLDVCCADSE